jgi:acetyl-CoA carboxylase biotin carboxyl carrier protein
MSGFKIDEEAIRKLAELLNDTGLTEIEIEDGDRSLRVSRAAAASVATVAAVGAPTAMPAAAAAPAPVADQPAGTQVTSPMVGTVYMAGAPGAAPFIKVGDSVKEGDTLLIVEAMKVMNPIKAPKGGKIVKIAVSDAQPVEYGEVLVIIG